MNMSAMGEVLSALSSPTDWILRYIKTYLFMIHMLVSSAAYITLTIWPELAYLTISGRLSL